MNSKIQFDDLPSKIMTLIFGSLICTKLILISVDLKYWDSTEWYFYTLKVLGAFILAFGIYVSVGFLILLLFEIKNRLIELASHSLTILLLIGGSFVLFKYLFPETEIRLENILHEFIA